MFTYNNESILIKNEVTSNKKFFFYNTDDEISYEKNLKKLGDDWYYTNKQITYEYNSYGYRTKEFVDINENYFITFGCSNTEGVGLENEKTWPNLVSFETKYDVFNLGMSSTSIDFQYFNTILLCNHIIKTNKIPKFVVYLWPSSERTTFLYKQNNEYILDIMSANYSPIKNNEIKNKFYEFYKTGFVIDEGEKIKQNFFSILSSNLLWKTLNVFVINLTYDDNLFNVVKNETIDMNYIKIDSNISDLARDRVHYGINIQKQVKSIILEKLTE
jgi:hypothetical protein